jgi:hypothetical protein
MALKVQSLDELDPTLVSQAQAELSQLMQERHPEVELTGGVFHDLVAYFAGGVSGGINQTEIDRVLQSNSLLAINTNPQLADPALADGVFSNYRITRNTGTAAAGEIAIVVTESASIILSAGTQFEAEGNIFVADQAYIARPPGSVVSGDNERVLEPVSGDQFVFSINATAAAVGTQGNIRRNTQLIPSVPISRFVTSYAATDFSGGTDTETNEDVLTRLQLGIAAKAWSNRINIIGLIKEQPLFAQTKHYSIIGAGNPELQRAFHSIIPVALLGRADIYARTTDIAKEVTLRKTAVLVSKLVAGSTWQFAIARDDAPGFYEVRQVLLTGSDPSLDSGFEVTSDVRGFDLSGTGFLPDIVTAVEATYSRYQTAVIQFLDTETDVSSLAIGAKLDYDVIVSAMPLIAELQDFIGGSDVRDPGGDVLVKAAVPCFLSINFDIEQAAGETAPDLTVIRNQIAATVNARDFPGQLHSSIIADIVHNYLTKRQALGPIDLHGRIRQPDGSIVYVRDKTILEIPEKPSMMTTGRTTAFLLSTNDIGISVVTKGFKQSI